MRLEKGYVKFFDSVRRFGFLIPEGGGRDVFFHFDDGAHLIAVESQLRWGFPPKRRELWFPKPGDVLVFDLEQEAKGPKASSWTYESLYQQALKGIVVLPRYRLREQITLSGSEPHESRTLWEGTNLDDQELKRIQHPRLGRFFLAEEGFERERWFEVHRGGNWSKFPGDPRLW